MVVILSTGIFCFCTAKSYFEKNFHLQENIQSLKYFKKV